jgi:hypothetical protein
MGDEFKTCGARRGAYRVLLGKNEGERPLEGPERRWGDDSKMDIQEVVWGYMNWFYKVQARNR